MFKLWVKEIKDNHLLKDVTIEDLTNDTRTHKIMHSLEKACVGFDLAIPIWLDSNIKEFYEDDDSMWTFEIVLEA